MMDAIYKICGFGTCGFLQFEMGVRNNDEGRHK